MSLEIINKLPTEILLMIFSYLDTSNVINSTAVCKRWRQVIFGDTLTWKNRWYTFSSSQHFRASVLKRLVSLNNFKFVFRDVNLKLITSMHKHGIQIKKLDLLYASAEMNSILQFLTCKFENVEYLSFSARCDFDYELIYQFHNLKELKIENAYKLIGRHLRTIVDCCRQLSVLHLPDSRGLIDCDIDYLIEKQHEHLQILSINGYGLTESAFQNISKCKNLSELYQVHQSFLSVKLMINILKSLPRLKSVYVECRAVAPQSSDGAMKKEGKYYVEYNLHRVFLNPILVMRYW